MRYCYVKLTGYIGLYNGLGIPSIEIDFSKAKNRICVISGPNGVGKSTIINALQLMPDSNELFLKNMDAQKYLCLTDGINTYQITFNHRLKNGIRQTTKVSFVKNGQELNPNGNVSSYKDIVQNEFDLDPNYMALSKIGSNDRGLADKTPAERKKVVANIIDSLEVYNDMYKVLNKKANGLKTLISSIGYKMQNLGNEESLISQLKQLDSNYERLNNELGECRDKITQAKTIVSVVDPNGTISEKLDRLKKQQSDLELEISRKQRDIKDNYSNINQSADQLKESINQHELKQAEILTKSASISQFISRLKIEMDKLKDQLSQQSVSINPDLVNNLTDCRVQMKSIESDFNKVNIDINNISKDELIHFIDFSNNLLQQIDILYEDTEDTNIGLAATDIMENNNSLVKQIEANKKRIKDIENIRYDLEDQIHNLTDQMSNLDRLKKRPVDCNNSNCPFIADALKITKIGNGDPFKYYDKISDKKDSIIQQDNNLLTEKADLENSIENLEKAINISTKIRQFIDSIQLNFKILNKIPLFTQISDKTLFLTALINHSNFTEYRTELPQYKNLANDIVIYQSLKTQEMKLSEELKIQQSTQKMIDQYQKDYDNKQNELKEAEENLDKYTKDKYFIDDVLKDLNNQLSIIEKYESIKKDIEDKEKQKADISTEISSIIEKLNSASEQIAIVNSETARLYKIQSELEPITEAKRNTEAKLNLYRSSKLEYDTYNNQYNLINILKKYASPTAGGIQSLFMSMYMDNTLAKVNQLLGMIFNGQYQILQYVINENEFRIPFIGNGLTVDDISSGSTSQVCIMGMIINLVLFTSGSTKYNVVSMDEIDGGLDHENRYLFVNILQQICDILQIDQLFIISHSVESALQAVDVILLSDDDYYTGQFAAANVIYQYHRKKGN